MPVATVTFRKCIINAPAYGTDSHHIGSRVIFDLDIDGEAYPDLSVDVRQPADTEGNGESLEVTWPEGYTGPFNFHMFQELVRFYFRHIVGAQALLFGTKLFQGYTVTSQMHAQFEIES